MNVLVKAHERLDEARSAKLSTQSRYLSCMRANVDVLLLLWHTHGMDVHAS